MPSKEKAMTMREVFEECQKGNYHHSKLLKRCRQIYDETDDKSDFNKEFIHYLKYAIIVMKREPAVERMLDFAAKFAVSFADESPESSRNESTISQDEGNEDSFLQFFFNFFLQSHGANYAAVRFRSCQMINKLLNSMGDDAQIDDNLFDKIYDNMLVRLRDKMAYVRVQAVTALARLQDPTDKNCPVIKAYMYMLNCDPNYEVRRTILNCIAPSAQTLPVVLKRTHDVKDDVRKLAFNVLAEKIHVKAMRISQRVELLQDGLNDRSELVKQTCATKLLQAWLRTFQGNVIDLLNCLDVESSSDVAEQALNSLFKSVPADELMSNFDLLNDKMVIDEDSLDCESALYWKCLCQHIKSLGDAGDEYLEKLLPTLSQFCDYVQSYMVKIKPSKNLDNVEETLRQEFIAQQLLILAGVLDLTDEVGRKRLDKLVHDMLVSPDISASLVKFLLERFNDLHSDVNSRITKVAEIISDVREPITVVETQENEKKKRQRDLKLAGVRVKLNQLKDDLENSVTKQEFAIAAEIKVEIAKLDEAKAKLLAEEEDSALIQEVRTEKNDPATLTKCLSIASEMLQELSTSSLNPVLRTLADTLIIPGIQNADPVVRNLAVKSLGLCCQLSKDFAKQYLLLLMQVSQVDQETIRVTAIQSIFDLLLLFGFNSFNTCDEDKSNESKDSNDDEEEGDGNANNDDGDASQSDKDTSKDKEESNVAHSVLNIMTTLLDCESSEIRTVAAEGLCKLLLSGRIVSSKLISRLVILWYNPITEDDTRLRHCLGSFLPLYAFASRTHQECVGEAFLPTLNVLFNAPVFSPLGKISESNVADLLVALTDHTNMQEKNKNVIMEDCTVHDTLAIKLCNEILTDEGSPGVLTLCKVLTQLDLTSSTHSTIEDLQILVKQMSMVVDDKAAKKLVQKFETQLNQLAEKEEKQSNEIKTPAAEPAEIETSKDDEKKKSEKENEHQAMSSEVTITVDEPPPTPTTQKPTPDILTSIEESAADHTPKRQTRSKGKNKAGITFLGSTSKTPSLKSKSSKGSIPMEDDSCSDLENDVFVTPAPPSCTVTKKQPSTRKSQRKSKPQKELDVESPVATRRSTRHSSQQKTDAKAKLVQLLSDSDSHADDEPDLNIKRRTRRSKTLSSKSYKV